MFQCQWKFKNTIVFRTTRDWTELFNSINRINIISTTKKRLILFRSPSTPHFTPVTNIYFCRTYFPLTEL